MSERRVRRPRWSTVGLALLLVLLAAAILLRPGEGAGLRLADPDRTSTDEIVSAFQSLPGRAMVLVGMDGDLGTYPEIRPAVRAAMDDLLRRGDRLAFISFSPEGRALASAEQQRLLEAGALRDAILDLGYVTGVEAGMVRSVTDLLPRGASGPFAEAVRAGGGGMAAFSLVLVVSGSDLTARSWVEQVGSRLPELPLVAIAPTFAQPELEPYHRTGQLAGLLATVRDDAAFTSAVIEADPRVGPSRIEAAPSSAAMLLGMLVALGFLLVSLAGALARPRASEEQGR